MTVGFVVANIANPLLAEITLGAETSFQAAGYSMLVTNSMSNPVLDAEHIRLLTRRRVDGLLLSVSSENWQTTNDAIERAGLPIVLVDRELDLRQSISSVLAEHNIGVADAVRHLAAMGHTRIALVNGPADLRPSRDRANTLRRVSRQLGISCVVRSGEFSADHGERSVEQLLSQPDAPTAIVVGSNQILVGVLRQLRRSKCQVPGDISIVTCDEVPLAEFLEPPLATIERNNFEMGVLAAQLLLELISGKKARTVRVPTTYHSAGSVGPAPTSQRTKGR
jgi:LacI family transcriptional regulator